MISLTKIKTLRDMAIEHVKRLSRERHPDGWFIEDKIYWLSSEEYCTCCKKQYSSTKKHPDRLSTHARTIDHIAHKFNVDAKELRKEVKEYRKTLKE
jgi:hypothetical protein